MLSTPRTGEVDTLAQRNSLFIRHRKGSDGQAVISHT